MALGEHRPAAVVASGDDRERPTAACPRGDTSVGVGGTGCTEPKRSAGGKWSAGGPDKKTSTGFTFLEYSPVALMNALTRALIVFGDAPRWRALQVAGMLQDFSWDRSAAEYVKIYDRARGSGTRRGNGR